MIPKINNRKELCDWLFNEANSSDGRVGFKKQPNQTWEQFYDSHADKNRLGADIMYACPLESIGFVLGVEEFLRVGGDLQKLKQEWDQQNFGKDDPMDYEPHDVNGTEVRLFSDAAFGVAQAAQAC